MTITGKMEPFRSAESDRHRPLLALQHQAQAASSKRELLES
jgi:hypothetical protein